MNRFRLAVSAFVVLCLFCAISTSWALTPDELKKAIEGHSVNSASNAAEQIKLLVGQDRTKSRAGPEANRNLAKNRRQDVAHKIPSNIERAYRLQYGKILLNQIISLDDWLQKDKRHLSPRQILNTQLTQFGYNFFEEHRFLPLDNIVPDANYVLGPGDSLRIRAWGNELDIDFTATIDRDGRIFLPKMGLINLIGTRYGDLNTVLAKETGKYIQGMTINAVLENPRSVQIYVAGQVNKPGLIVVPAFSTVLTALTRAGGVARTGSLRHIQIFRNDKLNRELDVYDLIDNGDKKNDILVQDRDVIYVPYIGPSVAVVGAVVRPGIFELAGSGTGADVELRKILGLAGGRLHQAHSRVYIRHFTADDRLETREIDLDSSADQKVENGDLVEVRYINPGMTTAVKLRGHVWEPIEMEYRPGLKLSDILNDPQNIKPGAIMDFAVIKRYMPLVSDFTTLRFPLKKLLEGKFNMELRPYDEIDIYARDDFDIHQTVSIQGAVWKPGEYDYEPGLSLSGLVAKAGGTKYGARLANVELTRQTISRGEVRISHHTVDFTAKDMALEPFDTILVPQINHAGEIRRVTASGEVRYPGTYAIKKGEHLSDLIARAGGFTDKAYFYGAKFTSTRARDIQQKSIDRMIEELELRAQRVIRREAQTAVSPMDVADAQTAKSSIVRLINHLKTIKAEGRVTIYLSDLKTFRGSQYDFELNDGDCLVVPQRPNFVNVIGSVYTSSAFLYQPDKTVGYYLRMAGGPSKGADEDHIYVLKANGEVYSKSAPQGLFHRFYSTRLMPGDTIVVPENLERVPYLRMVKDITEIMFRIASTVGITAVIAK